MTGQLEINFLNPAACFVDCVVVSALSSQNTMIMTNFAILDLDEWKTEIRTNGGAVQDYTISYQNLKPSTTYYFRVIAYNEFGISEPCTNDETVRFLPSYF